MKNNVIYCGEEFAFLWIYNKGGTFFRLHFKTRYHFSVLNTKEYSYCNAYLAYKIEGGFLEIETALRDDGYGEQSKCFLVHPTNENSTEGLLIYNETFTSFVSPQFSPDLILCLTKS